VKSQTKLVVGGVIGAIILVILFFIPTNEFFGTDSYNSESPPPIVVLNNYQDDFEITPTSCTRNSDSIEFQFSIANNLDDDYRLEIHLVLNDNQDQLIAKQAILVETYAGETTFEKYQMPLDSRLYSCGIEMKHFEEVT